MSKENMDACGEEVSKAVNDLLLKHDARLVMATLLAEAAVLGSAFICNSIHTPEFIAGMFAEGACQALTLKSKSKVVFTDGKDTGSRQ